MSEVKPSRARAFRMLALDLALTEVLDAFERRGIRALLLKGPAFAQWLYDTHGERGYGDIDLLVAPGWIGAAENALRELGFEQELAGALAHEQSPHHEKWVRRRSGGGSPAIVELHHTMRLLSADPALVWERLSTGAETITVDGREVEVPSEAGRALVVVLHCAQHGSGDARHLEDLRRALERVSPTTWQQAAALAQALDATEAFAAGLRLLPSGDQLADTLGLPARISRVLRLRASTPPDTTLGLEQLITTRGVRGRLTLIARELVPSRAWMRRADPLAATGEWGMALAYLRRPFVLAVKLPRGIRAWLRIATERQPSSARPREKR